MNQPPETIYLQYDPEGETTWCEDQINDDDIEYLLKSRAEKDEAELAAHIIAYNEEVYQFNAGYVAGEKGGLDPFGDQPHYEPDHDSWRNGYYAGSYDRLTRELAALKEQTRLARELIYRELAEPPDSISTAFAEKLLQALKDGKE